MALGVQYLCEHVTGVRFWARIAMAGRVNVPGITVSRIAIEGHMKAMLCHYHFTDVNRDTLQ